MNANAFPSASHRIRPVSIAALLAVSGLMSGCGGEDPVEQALASAEAKLNQVGLAGSAADPNVALRKTLFTEAATALRGVGEGASPVQVAAAGVLKSRAEAGLAEIHAAVSAEGESKFINDVISARAVLDQWVDQNATADALAVYDPAKDLGELDKQIAAKRAEAQAKLEERNRQEQAVAAIRAQAQREQDATKPIRARETELRTQAATLAATPRAAAIEQAAQVGREADAGERRAAEFLAQAAKAAPVVEELQREADKLKNQTEILLQAKKEIQARADAGKQHAARARTEAQDAGKKVGELINALGTSREALAGPGADAAKGYSQAIAAAKKSAIPGARDSKAGTAAAVGSLQAQLGDVLSTKVRGVGAFAAFLRDAAAARPAIPGGSGLSEKAAAAKGEFDTLYKEAQSAYEASLESFKNSGGSGEIKSRMEGVTKALGRLIEERSKLALDPAAVEQEIRQALKTMADDAKSGDFAAAMKHLTFKDDKTKAAVEGMVPLVEKMKALSDAAKEKFGKDLFELIKTSSNPGVKANPILSGFAQAGLGGMGMGLSSLAGDDAKIAVESQSRAKVSAGGQNLGVVKADGEWKIVFEFPPAMATQMTMMAPMLPAMQSAMGGVADAVKADQFKTADEALLRLAQDIMKAAMGAAAPQGAPPGDKPADKPAGKPSGG